MKIALTGHRPERLNLPADELNAKWDRIGKWIAGQYESFPKPITAYCGMADGSDMKFGLTLSEFDDVHLVCVLPCKDYNKKHPYFSRLRQRANDWVELSDKFYKGCDSVRDQFMVDNCDVLLAIWDGNKSGGVWSTIRKAQKSGKQVIYIPTDFLN